MIKKNENIVGNNLTGVIKVSGSLYFFASKTYPGVLVKTVTPHSSLNFKQKFSLDPDG